MAAAALIPLRDDLVSTNIALLLVVVVVAVAATGHRLAAALAALFAAGAFNFFHTQPYYSLRINSSDDVETAVLLLRGRAWPSASWPFAGAGHERWPNGAAVTSRACRAWARWSPRARTPTTCSSRPSRSCPSCSGSWTAASRPPTQDNRILPVIHRDGSVKWGPTPWETERWGLPTDGATIPVWSRGARLGRFVLQAPLAVPYTSAELAQAVALVDQAGAALARRPANT